MVDSYTSMHVHIVNTSPHPCMEGGSDCYDEAM